MIVLDRDAGAGKCLICRVFSHVIGSVSMRTNPLFIEALPRIENL